MNQSAMALITAGTGLAGAAIGGGATYIAHVSQRRGERQDELRAALTAFLYALDVLHLELSQLPKQTRVDRALNRFLSRARNVDFLLGQVSRHTLGRPAARALDQFLQAQNRLLLVAPREIVATLRATNELLSRSDRRHETQWQADWNANRRQLHVEAHALVA
jgi:hypothetical protein